MSILTGLLAGQAVGIKGKIIHMNDLALQLQDKIDLKDWNDLRNLQLDLSSYYVKRRNDTAFLTGTIAKLCFTLGSIAGKESISTAA